jgi:hypothetical protein
VVGDETGCLKNPIFPLWIWFDGIKSDPDTLFLKTVFIKFLRVQKLSVRMFIRLFLKSGLFENPVSINFEKILFSFNESKVMVCAAFKLLRQTASL